MADDEESIPLISARRLRSLSEFRRPAWFPKFEMPEGKEKGLGTGAVVAIGVVLGAAIGLFVW